MVVEVKVPSVGESVTEALLAQWFKSDGDTVKKDEPLFVIETDKVTLEVVSEAEGKLSIQVQEGETVAIGAVVGTIDSAAAPKSAEPPPTTEAPEAKETQPPAAAPGEPPAPPWPVPPIIWWRRGSTTWSWPLDWRSFRRVTPPGASPTWPIRSGGVSSRPALSPG